MSNGFLGSISNVELAAIPKNVSLHSLVLPSVYEPMCPLTLFAKFLSTVPLSVKLHATPKDPDGSSNVTCPSLTVVVVPAGLSESDLFADAAAASSMSDVTMTTAIVNARANERMI